MNRGEPPPLSERSMKACALCGFEKCEPTCPNCGAMDPEAYADWCEMRREELRDERMLRGRKDIDD